MEGKNERHLVYKFKDQNRTNKRCTLGILSKVPGITFENICQII